MVREVSRRVALHLPGAARTSIIPDVQTLAERRQPWHPAPAQHLAAWEAPARPRRLWSRPHSGGVESACPRQNPAGAAGAWSLDRVPSRPDSGPSGCTRPPAAPAAATGLKAVSRSLRQRGGTECPLLPASEGTPPTAHWLLAPDGPSRLVVPPSLQIQVGPTLTLDPTAQSTGLEGPGPGSLGHIFPSQRGPWVLASSSSSSP